MIFARGEHYDTTIIAVAKYRGIRVDNRILNMHRIAIEHEFAGKKNAFAGKIEPFVVMTFSHQHGIAGDAGNDTCLYG